MRMAVLEYINVWMPSYQCECVGDDVDDPQAAPSCQNNLYKDPGNRGKSQAMGIVVKVLVSMCGRHCKGVDVSVWVLVWVSV